MQGFRYQQNHWSSSGCRLKAKPPSVIPRTRQNLSMVGCGDCFLGDGPWRCHSGLKLESAVALLALPLPLNYPGRWKMDI